MIRNIPDTLRRPVFRLASIVTLAVSLVVTGVSLSAQAKRDENWVSTWSTAPVARPLTPAAGPGAGAGGGGGRGGGAATTAPATTTAPPAVATAPAGGRGAGAAAATATVTGVVPAGGANGAGAGRGAGGPGGGGAPGAAAGGGAGRGGGAAALMTPNNQTLRQIVHISLGGERARVLFSNSFGTRALTIGGASIALRGENAAIVTASMKPLTFSGQTKISIPPGATLLSDPVALSIPTMGDVAIDMFLPEDTSASTLTRHGTALQTNYAVAGNMVGAADLPGATTFRQWYFLSRVEIVAPSKTPVVVANGDSITDGTNSTPDKNSRWPDYLEKRLVAQKKKIAVVNAGIAANKLLSDAAGDGGVSMLARLDRDALIQSGATHMIFMLGINDIGSVRANASPTVEDLIAGHRQVIARAHALGIKIMGATLTPFEGFAAYYTPEGEAKRKAVNEWIRTSKEYDAVVDFDAVVRDPQAPTKILTQYDSGDHLHPGDAGYEAMAKAIDLNFFK